MALLKGQIFLQKSGVGLPLHLDEIGDVHHPLYFAEILTI